MQKQNEVDFIVFIVNLSPLLIPTAISSIILFFYSVYCDIDNWVLMIISNFNFKFLLPLSVIVLFIYIIILSFLYSSDFEPKN
jgi:hypothetical protein